MKHMLSILSVALLLLPGSAEAGDKTRSAKVSLSSDATYGGELTALEKLDGGKADARTEDEKAKELAEKIATLPKSLQYLIHLAMQLPERKVGDPALDAKEYLESAAMEKELAARP